MMNYLKGIKKNDKDLFELIKGGGVNFIFYGLNLFIVYFLAIIITKFYGPSAYGRYSIIKSLILIFIIFNTLGLNTFAIRLSSDRKHFDKGLFNSDYFKKSYIILFVASLILSTTLIIFKKEIAVSFFGDKSLESYLVYFPFVLIFATFLNYNSNVLKGQGKILLFSIVSSFLNNFIFICIILIGYFYYTSNESFIIISLLISFIVAFVVSIYIITPIRYSQDYKKSKYVRLLKDSLPMMLSSSMIFIIFSVDTLMLGFFDSSENVGIYRIVTQISGINAVFLIIIGAVVAPKISKLYSENKILEIKPLIIKSSKIVLLITLPILILILIFSKHILLFFGEEYLNAFQSILILSICQFFYAISGFVDLILNMTGKQRVFGKITFITAMINIILNLLLIPIYGITGAAISTGFSILLTNGLGAVYVKMKYNFLPFYIPFIKR
ncbi:MAG: oligosaccharide flippase family protein [Polaribacter sp.]